MSKIREQIEREKVWISSLLIRTNLDEDELESVGKELAKMYFEKEDLMKEIERLKTKKSSNSSFIQDCSDHSCRFLDDDDTCLLRKDKYDDCMSKFKGSPK